MTMQLTETDDPVALLDLLREHLEVHEDEHALLLSFLERGPRPLRFLAWAHDRGEILGVAYLTDRNLIVSHGMGAAAGPLAATLRDRGFDVPGIVGLEADVAAVAAAWGVAPSHVVAQGLYRLDAVTPPEGVPGRMRAMTDGDVGLVTAWILGFHQDALPFEPFSEEEARANAAARPAAGMTYLWEVDGVPVAMAALARPTRRGITVNAVYTPAEHRRRGYASALVAALSTEGLARREFCVLYTDLANPTANAIYQAVGYRPVARSKMVRFTSP